MTIHLLGFSLALYVGPDQILPLTSILGAMGETGGRRLQADPLGLRQGVTGTTVAAALRMKRRGRTRVAVAPPITRVRQHQAPSPLIRVNSPQ